MGQCFLGGGGRRAFSTGTRYKICLSLEFLQGVCVLF